MILLLAAAHAGTSLDVELYRARAGEGVLGVDGLGTAPRGTVQAAAVLQYSHDPLVLYDREGTGLAVVRDRATLQVAGRFQVARPLALRLGLPLITDWGAEDATRAAPGVGLGDLWIGGVADLLQAGPARLGAHLDVALPIGTRDAWRGEAGLRVVPGALAEVHVGKLGVFGETSLVLRPAVDTGDQLVAGVQIGLNVGATWSLRKDRAELTAALLDRIGIGADAGAPASELLAGFRAQLVPGAVLDVHLGRGLTLGYGAPDYRLGVGLTLRAEPARPSAPTPIAVSIATLPDVPGPEEAEPDVIVDVPAPVAIALARVEDDQILIRDPIQFELGTDRILPVSLPTLREVAALLQDHPEIAQLVIEGHASEEGSFLYNYDLSLRRASAIFKELVLAGVHPDRLSCRAMGEVAPAALGTDEVALAQSRRVVFRIARRLAPGEALPAYTRDILLPWNGDAATIPEPPPLAAPPPPPPPTRAADDIPPAELFEEPTEEPTVAPEPAEEPP